jgi:hypothetical protein
MAFILYQILLVHVTLACYLMLIYRTHCDSLNNILQNGAFTSLGVHFDLYQSLDMIANGINTSIPYYWICVQGSVQALDPTIYNPPLNSNITFIMHMNFYMGLGHIINMPMYMSCKGTMFSAILMNIANNPDGGPSKKKSCQTSHLMILNFYFF